MQAASDFLESDFLESDFLESGDVSQDGNQPWR